MRWLLLVLILILALFQYWFWLGEGGLLKQSSLEKQVLEQRQENSVLKERNAAQKQKLDTSKMVSKALKSALATTSA